jgi:hypothetical protein
VTMLVSLAQAKLHLRADSSTFEDADIALKIRAASLAVLRHIKLDPAEAYTDSAGFIPLDTAGDPIGVPEDVQAAVLLLLGLLYRDRDGEGKDLDEGFMPRSVRMLLTPYRDPTLA